MTSVFVAIVFSAFMSMMPMQSAQAAIVPCGRIITEENDGNKKNPQQIGSVTDPCTLCHLFVGIDNIIRWGLKIVAFISTIIIVIAGIMYIVSTGNESMMQAAKKALMYALAGVAIMLLGWVIVHFVIGMVVGNMNGNVNIQGGGTTYWGAFSCTGNTTTPPTTNP